jgi:hypothetical protein
MGGCEGEANLQGEAGRGQALCRRSDVWFITVIICGVAIEMFLTTHQAVKHIKERRESEGSVWGSWSFCPLIMSPSPIKATRETERFLVSLQKAMMTWSDVNTNATHHKLEGVVAPVGINGA